MHGAVGDDGVGGVGEEGVEVALAEQSILVTFPTMLYLLLLHPLSSILLAVIDAFAGLFYSMFS
jgi:hypothetical protein